VHSLCLLCGAVGLISVGFIHGIENRGWLHLSLGLVGIAWASILAMPYAMLAGSLPPAKTGVYMGIFNFFIVLPEIAAALCFDKLMGSVLHNNQVAAVMADGAFLLLASVLAQFVREVPAPDEQLERVVEEEGMLPTMTPPERPLA
jgi:maltose/moltooligosaccharide transporter